MARSCKRHFANLAREGSVPLVLMFLPVIDKMALSGEGLAASSEVTTERLLTSMDSDVGLQVSILGKALATDITPEGLLSCVSPLVDFEPT